MSRDRQSLLDMLQSARLAVDYLNGRSFDELSTDSLLEDAVVRRLSIIGEAANRISETTRAGLPEIPWNAVRGMRNRLVHEYDGVDLEVVWDTVRDRLPELIMTLETVLDS